MDIIACKINMDYLYMESVFEKAAHLLDKDGLTNRYIRRKLIRTKSREDQYRSLASRLVVRYVLNKEFLIPYSLMKLALSERGKPYLEGYPNCLFNISHSGEWVACAIDNCPIGIDIEKIIPVDYLGIAQRYFSHAEYNTLMNYEKGKRLEYFYEIWTLKESYVKNTGEGITYEHNSITIDTNESDPELASDGPIGKVFFKQYYLETGYKMAVCARSKVFPKNVSILDFGIILKTLTE